MLAIEEKEQSCGYPWVIQKDKRIRAFGIATVPLTATGPYDRFGARPPSTFIHRPGSGGSYLITSFWRAHNI